MRSLIQRLQSIKPKWTPAFAGVLIGLAVLVSYLFYDPNGMCVGCSIGNNLSWIEYQLTKKSFFFPGIPTLFRTHIIGMFIGAFVAAVISKEFWIKRVKPKPVLISLLAGALIGFGNFLASGCPVRHIIVGIPGMVGEAWLATGGIVLGIYLGILILRRIA